MVIPILGWPPLWFGLLAAATAATIWLWYRTAGLAGLLVPALLVGAWGQQLLNGNSQAIVVWLLAITPLAIRVGLAHGSAAVGPVALAVATMLKIHPVIGLVWFAGRRDWRAIGLYGAACAVLLLLQLPWLGDFDRLLPQRPGRRRNHPGHEPAGHPSRRLGDRVPGGPRPRLALRGDPVRVAPRHRRPARRPAARAPRQPGAAAGGSASASAPEA